MSLAIAASYTLAYMVSASPNSMLVEQMQELAPGISLAPDCVDPDSADEEDQKPFLHGRTEAQKQDGPVP